MGNYDQDIRVFPSEDAFHRQNSTESDKSLNHELGPILMFSYLCFCDSMLAPLSLMEEVVGSNTIVCKFFS